MIWREQRWWAGDGLVRCPGECVKADGGDKEMEMSVVDAYFKRKWEVLEATQVGYILSWSWILKEIKNCKMEAGESISRKHRMCGLCDDFGGEKEEKCKDCESRIRRWKLKQEDRGVKFRVVIRTCWKAAKILKKTARKLAGLVAELGSLGKYREEEVGVKEAGH